MLKLSGLCEGSEVHSLNLICLGLQSQSCDHPCLKPNLQRPDLIRFPSAGNLWRQDRVRDFDYFLAASVAQNCKNTPVIKSAASTASAREDCASSRLDHSLKFRVTREDALAADLFTDAQTALSFEKEQRMRNVIWAHAVATHASSVSTVRLSMPNCDPG